MDSEPLPPKALRFIGTAHDDLKTMPDAVRSDFESGQKRFQIAQKAYAAEWGDQA